MIKMYPPSRPKVAHPVYEIASLPAMSTSERGFGPHPDDRQPPLIELPGATLTEDIDPLERIAVIRKRDQYGYHLGDLEEARSKFQEAIGDLPMPWRRR
jgi:hypothetical protein